MKIVYFSLTGNVKRFLTKADLIDQAICVKPDLVMNQGFILITPTIGFGEIPADVVDFLKYNDNYRYLQATVGSGNKNWGVRYCKAAKTIAETFKVENIFNFELAGNQHDVETFKEILEKLERDNDE